VVKIAVPSRKIDIDEYRDFASYKSISLKHRHVTAASCMFIQLLLLLIALVAEIEIGII